MNLLIAALVFVGVAALLVSLGWAFEGQWRVRERLEGASVRGPAPNVVVLRPDAAQAESLVGKLLTAGLSERLLALIEQSGSRMSLPTLLSVMIACAAGGALVGWIRVGSVFFTLILAVIFSALPVVYLMVKRRRRLQRFAYAFPDACDAMARAIRAGNALSGAIQLVADEMPDPIGEEFRRVFEEFRLGMDPADALARLQTRVPMEDVKFFCTAIKIQRSSGGNLAEILDRLSEVIRERFKLLSHARVLSAQHRWTAICVGVSPLIFVLIFQLMQPDYFDPLLKSPLGPTLLGVGVVLEAVGFAVIWRIAKIEV